MTDPHDRSPHRPDGDAKADPDADAWSAWLPTLDATAATTADATGTGAASPRPTGPSASADPASTPKPPGPPLPQSAGPGAPSASSPPPYPAPPAAAVGAQPRSHLGLAIVTLFFGLPIVSIAAIVAAAAVGSLWKRGRHADAQRASRAALGLSIAALVLNAVWRVVQANTMMGR